jgi:hypothetical protein
LLRNRSILFIFLISVFIIIVFCVPSKTKSQAWSGLLAPNRAINWSSAGAGTIPTRTTICQTLGTAGQSPTYSQSVTAAQIVAALQACAGKSQTVYLNPGTYTMTTTLFGPGDGGATPSNVTLRGAGPQQTILTWASGASLNNCNGIGPVGFCIYNGDSDTLQYSVNILGVTGGYTQGSTSLTLSSTAVPAQCCDGSSSISNLHVGSLLALAQCDTGYSGYPCAGTATDNGNWFNCGQPPPSSGTAPCTWGGNSNAFTNAAQTQIVTVTGISGSTVTFTPALYAPNWSSGQSPFVFFSSTLPVTGFGMESLQINTQQLGDIQGMVQMLWVSSSWVKNVAFINNVGTTTASTARKHLEISSSAHITFRDSYMYGSSPSSEAYGVDFMWGTSDSLVENNIAQHMASAYMLETGIGNVFGYNFDADNFYTGGGGAPNWQQCELYHHNEADYYDLFEGHEGICAAMDDGHGTSFGLTYFRNYLNGHDPATLCPGGGTACGTGPKLQATDAFGISWGSRYNNIIMNVLGDGVYANVYQNVGVSGNPNSCPTQPETVIYSLNFANGNQIPFSPACTQTGYTLDNDPLVAQTLVRWGNYDTVNKSVETNSSETASGAAVYPGLSGPSTSWSSYPSLYYTSKPSWWGSMAWPAVGPDVTGGNIPNVGGHAYHNPAANCYLNVLGGKTDGSSGPLNFDANNCYANSASSGGPPAPLNLTGTVVQ